MAETEETEKEDFKITKDEASKLREAMKKPEFRKLLQEYAQEISDPENKKKYEEELIALEKQRGVDMKYIHPTPGFVMKSFLLPEGTEKIFINVCHSDAIDPASSKSGDSQNKKGVHWSIPYSFTPPREDTDKTKNKCTVVDAVFNTETFHKGKDDLRFKKMLIDTIFDGLEKQLQLKIDRERVIHLQMPYKGTAVPSVVRKKVDEKQEELPKGSLLENIPFPPLKPEQESDSQSKDQPREKEIQEPKHTVVYRGEFSMQDFTNDRESTLIKRPKELVVTVQLPGVKSSAAVELDIFKKKLVLQCETPMYKLDLALTYPIDEEKGKAIFDKVKKTLTITLPVLPPKIQFQRTEAGSSMIKPDAQEHSDQRHQDGKNTDDHESPTEIVREHSDQLQQNGAGSVDKIQEHSDQLHQNGNESSTGRTGKMQEEHSDQHQPDESLPRSTREVQVKTSQESQEEDTSTDLSKEWSSKGEWQCPPFNHRQDETTVAFCLHTPNVKEKSVVKYFEDHNVQMTYSTSNEEKYSFYVSFPESCSIDVDDCTIDISEENVVLLLKKDVSETADDTNLWEKFFVGLNANQTTEKLFLTVSNVQSIIEKIDDLPNPWKNGSHWSDTATVSATLETDESQLDIVINDPRTSELEQDAGKTEADTDTSDATVSDTTRDLSDSISEIDPQTMAKGSLSSDVSTEEASLYSSEPLVRVEEDGSVFIKGDENYSKNRDAIVPALGGERSSNNKIKLENKLLYSLD